MNPPRIAAARFLSAVALGIPLGIWYSFLRPLRPKHTALSDLLFLPGTLWAWVFLTFGICRGDIRLAYRGAGARGLGLGKNGRADAAKVFLPILGSNWADLEFSLYARKKIFTNYKNFVCIWGKMGYNKME